MARFRRILLSFLPLLLLAGPALAGPEAVSIRTSDGQKLAGDLYATGLKGAPAVVALHMYRSDRKAWAPVIKPLNDAGIDLLAIDLRGHGESVIQGDEDLSGRVAERDPTLFNEMWRDAHAAMDFMVKRGNDPRRIAYLGASVGCSVAIDAAVRRESVRGVLLMTPGLGYLGVPTNQHIRDYGTRPMKILSSTFEADVGATAIKEAVGPTCSVDLFEKRNSHGTRMFTTLTGVEERIANWFAMILAAPVALDGELSAEEAKGFCIRSKLEVEGGELEALAWRRGQFLHAVLTGEPELFPARFMVAYAGQSMMADATALVVGRGRVSTQRLRDREGTFHPVRVRRGRHHAEPGAVKGFVMELLIPISQVETGFDPLRGFRLAFAIGPADTTKALTWIGRAKPGDVKTWFVWPAK